MELSEEPTYVELDVVNEENISILRYKEVNSLEDTYVIVHMGIWKM